MSLKCSLFYAHFQCRIMANNSEFIELRSFWLILVKTIDFLGGSMGEMIGRGMPNVLLLFYIAKVSHYGGRRDRSK